MKKTLSTLILGTVAFALPQLASAALLVGHYDAASFSSQETTSGFSGLVGGSATPLGAFSWNSTDGTYGSGPTAPTNVGGQAFGFGGDVDATINFTVTNGTGSDYTLSHFFFDISRAADTKSIYGLEYSLDGADAVALTVPTAVDGSNITGNSAEGTNNWDSFASTYLGVVLEHGKSIVFTWHANHGGGLDNIGLTGELSAIPETGSIVALGCLVGSGAFLRTRRRTAKLA